MGWSLEDASAGPRGAHEDSEALFLCSVTLSTMTFPVQTVVQRPLLSSMSPAPMSGGGRPVPASPILRKGWGIFGL